jgi:MFS superfamily sulfate permease-like transporter
VGLLLAARLAQLGFLANFLSRTVLVGFLTGVGIQVAAGQLPDMLGVSSAGSRTLSRLLDTVRGLPDAHRVTVAVSVAVILVVLAVRRVARRAPGTLIAVIGAIIVSQAADLAGRGVAVVGVVPRGPPHLGLPALGWHDATALLGTAVALFVVILAQSAATSRAYAVKYEEPFREETDLVGLGAANVAAALSGTFVGERQPDQDSGGRQRGWAQSSWPRSPPPRWCSSSCSCSPGLSPSCRSPPWRRWSSSSPSNSSTSAGCGAS